MNVKMNRNLIKKEGKTKKNERKNNERGKEREEKVTRNELMKI